MYVLSDAAWEVACFGLDVRVISCSEAIALHVLLLHNTGKEMLMKVVLFDGVCTGKKFSKLSKVWYFWSTLG